MLSVRTVLETLSVSQCCKLITEAEMYELKNIWQLQKRNGKGDYEKASQLDSQIHRYIAKISGNRRLENYINDIQDFFAYARPHKVKWTETKIKRSLQDHKKLVDAICNRDEDSAIAIIKEDIAAMDDLLKNS